jgi:hypothetical protein
VLEKVVCSLTRDIRRGGHSSPMPV